MNLPIEITEVMVIIVGLGVIIGLVVSLLIKDDGVVVIAITLAILLVIFLILEILFHPVSKVLYQFIFMIGALGIAIGIGLTTKLVVAKLSKKDKPQE